MKAKKIPHVQAKNYSIQVTSYTPTQRRIENSFQTFKGNMRTFMETIKLTDKKKLRNVTN